MLARKIAAVAARFGSNKNNALSVLEQNEKETFLRQI